MTTTKKLSKNQTYVMDCLKNQHVNMTYNVNGRVCFHAWTKYTNTIKSLVKMGLVEVVVQNKWNNKIDYVALPENKNKNKRKEGEYKIFNNYGGWHHLIVDSKGNEITLKSGSEYLNYKMNN